MAQYQFDIFPLKVCGTDAFAEASADEFRVLLALIEASGVSDTEALVCMTGIRAPRVASAVVFWQESGVLRPSPNGISSDKPTPADRNIVDEFEFRLRPDELDEENNTSTAQSIREQGLADLIGECAAMLGRPTLNDNEIRDITALYTQYGLSEDYILTLLHDLTSRSHTTVRTLVNRAIKLHDREIDTVEKLNVFFKDRDDTGEWERMLRHVLGIYHRALTKTEKEAFRRWVEDYGFEEEILTLAYDITIKNASRFSVAYMEKLLADWHRNGCRTIAECETRYGASKPIADKTPSAKQTKKEKPRYGTFDPEDVFKKALARSYGEGDESK